MPISLTKEQLLDRLSEPKRIKLLRLAIIQDAQSIVFPSSFEAKTPNNPKVSLPVAVGVIADTYLLRAIELAYEEFLD